MRDTKLILVEGIPGSGKSTSAQFIAHALTDQGHSVRWWYEEEIDHPVYLFRDLAGLDQVRDDLNGGRYPAVIAAALRQWRRFAALAGAGESIVVIDGCFFGYLTWSLFPLDVPAAEIMTYLTEVEQIIAPLNPALIVFRQEDVVRSLARVCARRGGNTEARFVSAATESAYGRRHGLHGFAGLARYWADYRDLIDATCAAAPFPTLMIETDAGDWSSYQRQCLRFLALDPDRHNVAAPIDPQRYSGSYRASDDAGSEQIRISAEGDTLLLDGLAELWPRTRLIPRGEEAFALEAFPLTIHFRLADAKSGITTLDINGPRLLGSAIPARFTRQES